MSASVDHILFVVVVALAFLFLHHSVEAQPAVPTSRITVVGVVFCDTCSTNTFSRHSYFLPGADVQIQCKFQANSPKTNEQITFSVTRTTDKFGAYKLEIPHVDGVDCVDGMAIESFCQASLIGSSSSACNVPGLKIATNEISVKSKQDSLCIYSLKALSYKPSKRNSSLCGKTKESLPKSTSNSSKFPNGFFLPPLPQLASVPKLPFPFPSPPSLPLPFTPSPPSLPFPFTPSPPSLPFPFTPSPPSFPFPFTPSPPSLPLPFTPSPPALPFPFTPSPPAWPFPFTPSPPSLPFPFTPSPPALPFPFTPSPPSLPFPFTPSPPSLPFPFTPIPPLFQPPPPPPPPFNLGDPRTWIPNIPLLSPPPPPAFNPLDPRTWTPYTPPSHPSTSQSQEQKP